LLPKTPKPREELIINQISMSILNASSGDSTRNWA